MIADPAPAPVKDERRKVSSAQKFTADLLAGGVAGAVSKTAVAPIERVKLLLQTQDSNPRIKSGEIPRYTGIVNCFTRVTAEQGVRLRTFFGRKNEGFRSNDFSAHCDAQSAQADGAALHDLHCPLPVSLTRTTLALLCVTDMFVRCRTM
jgi:hypothetical protein